MCGCIFSVTYSMIIIGRSTRRIKASRGLRPEDPLSTFLFLLVLVVIASAGWLKRGLVTILLRDIKLALMLFKLKIFNSLVICESLNRDSLGIELVY